MKLLQFSARRFRAFEGDVTVPLAGLTVLTGPNNLGKSTVLAGLNLIFGSGRRASSDRPSPRNALLASRTSYVFEEDYPKRLLNRRGRRWPTRLSVSMELSPAELKEATAIATLPLDARVELAMEFPFDRSNAASPSYWINGKLIARNDTAIARWLIGQIRYVYIPATRNIDDFRRSIFSEFVQAAGQKVGRSRKRLQLVEEFYNDIRKELSQVEAQLRRELSAFLPSVNAIRFVTSEFDLSDLVDVRDVEIDDGAPTSLRLKGDGFKSIFAISMLQYVARQQYQQNLVFGIEEPEAHLHPSAIYEVKETLRNLSETHQTLITTHSPILIERDHLESNIIIERSQQVGSVASTARSATSLTHIRQSLGIRPQDNMRSAEVVLLVEGATEEACLPALLARIQPSLSGALSRGAVRLINVQGAANAVAVARALARDAATALILLDGDEEGLRATAVLRNAGLLDPRDITQVPGRENCLETEFEDCFPSDLYVDEVAQALGIVLTAKDFDHYRIQSGGKRTRFGKWSHVMETICRVNGKIWADYCGTAKTAFGAAVAKASAQVRVEDYPWLRSMATRIQSYMVEQSKAA